MDPTSVGVSFGEWLLGGLGAIATVGASVLVIVAGRRDRVQNSAQDEFDQLQDQVAENTQDIAHISGFLEGTSDYKPRQR